MTQAAKTQLNSGRAVALARRKALSGSGKSGIQAQPVIKSQSSVTTISPATSQPVEAVSRTRNITTPGNNSRKASLARRRAMSSKGKTGIPSADRTRVDSIASKSSSDTFVKKEEAASIESEPSCGCGCKTSPSKEQMESTTPKTRTRFKRKPRSVIKSDSCRATALARRKAHASRGKAGISKNGMSSAQAARASNPDLSGRELARALRDQKSRRGAAGQKKSEPTGRMRPLRQTKNAAAEDAPWKVGASDTTHGQTVTGTMVGRSQTMTGDEASTCRDVTGTEYMGADIFKQFCQAEPSRSVLRTSNSSTGMGNSVTGNQVGRSRMVTGDEAGTCKNVTGNEYVDASQHKEFCVTPSEPRAPLISDAQTRAGQRLSGDQVERSNKVTGNETGASRELTGTQYMGQSEGYAPAKVQTSSTLSGGAITGSMVGRSERVTGDEAGSCRKVSGDDYIGREQYQSFCTQIPEKTDSKVGESKTFSGKTVTGTMTGRAGRVTGDEPGSCKTVTGTPYAGTEQYRGFCENEQTGHAVARMQQNKYNAGAPMTGLQPSIGGNMTGDSKGACEVVSGTPYTGRDQLAESCPALAAEPEQADFPQSLEQAAASDFSVTSPAVQAQQQLAARSAVTGSSYEQGTITGPFGMASGKVTGTEEARFSKVMPSQPAEPANNKPQTINNRPLSRITGEGMFAGGKITGDDWERGDRVTGTEGNSATRRNPTIRAATMAPMASMMQNRNEDMPLPTSPVTGGSGNTDHGALITYSGGARG